ncbi:hypothetical protein QJS10_CPA07g00791 [Acorus calamus]|uniref:Uncharacterized protein n=1 Tax=Acorus calamus TaxID=4465 RepID=A0AAV9EGX5_ACOCL|nr:hypothetical protein QJS10_CPA07g00791 [Acorus calamus]
MLLLWQSIAIKKHMFMTSTLSTNFLLGTMFSISEAAGQAAFVIGGHRERLPSVCSENAEGVKMDIHHVGGLPLIASAMVCVAPLCNL